MKVSPHQRELISIFIRCSLPVRTGLYKNRLNAGIDMVRKNANQSPDPWSNWSLYSKEDG
jgi:hypothetical protein